MACFAQSIPTFCDIGLVRAIGATSNLDACYASLRMTSNCPVTPPRKRFKGSEETRLSFRTPALWDPENPGGGSSALGSQMTLAGGADIVCGFKYCAIVSELELALRCTKTAPNYPIALPVRACAVAPS